MNTLRINRFLPSTKAEGPGNRSCIWVQGCPIRCNGCFNQEMWSEDGGFEIDPDSLFQTIISESELEGITILGGEPFAQAAPLAQLAKKIKKAGLSVIVFTGYTLEYLKSLDSTTVSALLSSTDILIDGPFVQEKTDLSRPWVGSSNQRYHFLTTRYKNLENNLANYYNRLEIRIMKNGQTYVNGLATNEIINVLFDDNLFQPFQGLKE